jgi:hypothetical protein
MYKLHVKLLILMCLMTPLAFGFGKTLPTNTPSTPAVALPVLEPEQFIKAVNENDLQTQNGLSAKLAKLLGATPPTSVTSVPATPSLPASTSVETLKTSPATEEKTDNFPAPAPAATGLNPYIN